MNSVKQQVVNQVHKPNTTISCPRARSTCTAENQQHLTCSTAHSPAATSADCCTTLYYLLITYHHLNHRFSIPLITSYGWTARNFECKGSKLAELTGLSLLDDTSWTCGHKRTRWQTDRQTDGQTQYCV